MKNNPVAYNVIFDKEKNDRLGTLMQLAHEHMKESMDEGKKIPWLTREMTLGLAELVEELSNKSHDVFGCEDPDCKHVSAKDSPSES